MPTVAEKAYSDLAIEVLAKPCQNSLARGRPCSCGASSDGEKGGGRPWPRSGERQLSSPAFFRPPPSTLPSPPLFPLLFPAHTGYNTLALLPALKIGTRSSARRHCRRVQSLRKGKQKIKRSPFSSLAPTPLLIARPTGPLCPQLESLPVPPLVGTVTEVQCTPTVYPLYSVPLVVHQLLGQVIQSFGFLFYR